MALQISKTFSNGVFAKECYVKIIDIDYTGNPDHIKLSIAYYYDNKSRLESLPYLEIKRFDVSTEQIDDNRETAYKYLKTLKEFENAEDI